MKKPLLITILFLFFFTFSYAQISFEKGYYILNDGSRIECFIRNIDWKNNPTDFKYKTQLSDNDFKTETIANVQEFGIDNETTFKKFKIKIDRTSDEPNKLLADRNPVFKEEVIFLKVLVKGDATLYSYTDQNLNRYFYETKTIPVEQLVYTKYYQIDSNGSPTILAENNEYKQQLFQNVKAENTTEKEIIKLNYNKSDLTKYFIKYNNIKPNLAKEERKVNKGIFLVKITPSASIASLSTENDYFLRDNVQLDNKINFKFGVEAEYILPYNKNKWSIFINPAYQTYQDDKTYNVPSGFIISPETPNNAKVKYTSIQIPIGIRHYMFLNQTSKIFINVAYAFDAGSKTNITYTDVTNKTTREYESGSGSNFAFGLGYNFKNKFSFEARLNTKKELMRDYLTYSAKYSSIDFVLGYTIF
ncbi:outer membrane beta-barrel protein [Flavobacterium sp. PL02]|uniref:outer membrane beta-barrel protein n=1 Tax=Flavobacterium sp. PL02 TaxID=3088354 RepID=UPI002B236C17|nr:outer membrane beta-barrel protein [Flavobacterium sp. PL02]MEA9415537.1 outer membrane beta-barrel protein [Flavobacterium sp. PL02]